MKDKLALESILATKALSHKENLDALVATLKYL